MSQFDRHISYVGKRQYVQSGCNAYQINLAFQKAYICILTVSLKCFWKQKYRDYELSK